ncbi:type II toxin-antitoxin system HicB family antitoxin [Undibacterium sp. JH2W]|uniref:type II toxin-antitoxin system HicB family antitoxin n=1 Tax=Undibacterium sp. JH2W TaxID=3413037 RepID=UPI003BF07A40
MRYPAKFSENAQGNVNVTFRDIPEAIADGDCEDSAIFRAGEALVCAMKIYLQNKRSVPMPSTPREGEKIIEIHLQIWAKILLLNEMVKQNVKPVELARKMNLSPQSVNRIVDIYHPTKIETTYDALKSLDSLLCLNTESPTISLTRWKFTRSETPFPHQRQRPSTDAVNALFRWQNKGGNNSRRLEKFVDEDDKLEAVLYCAANDQTAWNDLALECENLCLRLEKVEDKIGMEC